MIDELTPPTSSPPPRAGRLQSAAKKLLNFKSQAHLAIFSQIVTSAANFLTTVIIIHALGMEEFGKFSICFLLIMTVRNFEMSAVLVPISTIGPKLRTSTLAAYRGFSVVQALLFAGGSSLLLAVSAFPLASVLNLPWLSSVWLSLALANGTAVLAEYVRRHHFVYAAPGRAFFVDLLRFGTQIALLMLLWKAFLPYFSTNSTLFVLAISSAVGSCFGMIGHGTLRRSKNLSRIMWARHWNMVKWLMPGTTLETIQSNVPILIAGAIIGEKAIGLVRAMQTIANLLNLPANAMQQIIPSIAAKELHVKGLLSMRRKLAVLTVCMTSLYIVLSSAILLAYPIFSHYVFKEEGAGHALLFGLFCVVNILVGIRYSMQAFLVALERPKYLTYSNALSATLSILAVVFLIRQFQEYLLPMMSIGVIIISSTIYIYAIWFESKAYLSRHGK